MIKKTFIVLFAVFLLVSGLIIYYWRDSQFDPSPNDFIVYFAVVPLVITVILLSPWYLYAGFKAYAERKQRKAAASAKDLDEVAIQIEKETEVEWYELAVYASHVLSAYGEDQQIIDEIINFKSPTLDTELQNAYGLPILSYRMKEIDEWITERDEDETLNNFPGRQKRILALLGYQLEQYADQLIEISDHLKRSSLFYETQQISEYRMHPAWTDPSAELDTIEEGAIKQVARLDRLNVHVLLSEDLLHVWDEQSANQFLEQYWVESGLIPQKIRMEYRFVSQDTIVKECKQLFEQIETKSTEVSLLFAVDSEIDQDCLEERMWTSDHYIPSEYVISCCLASRTTNIASLSANKVVKLIKTSSTAKQIFTKFGFDSLEQYQQDTPFIVVVEDETNTKVIKQIQHHFEATPIEAHHYLYSKASLGHTQHLAKIYGLMLAMQIGDDSVAMMYANDFYGFIEAFTEEEKPAQESMA